MGGLDTNKNEQKKIKIKNKYEKKLRMAFIIIKIKKTNYFS